MRIVPLMHKNRQVETDMDPATPALLLRKRDDTQETDIAMRGCLTDVVRYFMQTPKKIRNQYSVTCNGSFFGATELELIARTFRIGDASDRFAVKRWHA
jgi:hypothetical protein